MRCIKAFIAWIKRKKKIPPRQFVFLSGSLEYLRKYNNGKVIYHLPPGKYIRAGKCVQIPTLLHELNKSNNKWNKAKNVEQNMRVLIYVLIQLDDIIYQRT